MDLIPPDRLLKRAAHGFCVLAALLLCVSPALADEVSSPEPELEPAESELHRTARPRSHRHTRTHRAPRSRAPRRAPGRVSQGWFHLGGGFGATVVDPSTRISEMTARGVIGGGHSLPFLYGGGELQLTGRRTEPLKLTGVGFVGLTAPTPVFRPQFGLRAGGGHHIAERALLPHVVVGPQVGFTLRGAGRRPGLRVMVDAGLEYRFEERELNSELMLTFSALF